MARYNNQSIDIDLEEMFHGLSNEDQEQFLVDMFQNLSEEVTGCSISSRQRSHGTDTIPSV